MGQRQVLLGRHLSRQALHVFWRFRPDTSTSRVLEALLILGLSLALLATVIVALLDPEPVTKLAAAGLSMAEAVALLLLLGYSREEVREWDSTPTWWPRSTWVNHRREG